MSRARLNLLLLAIVVSLAVVAVVTRTPEEAPDPLITADEASIRTIELRHPGADLIRLERDGGDWRLTAPFAVAADPLEVANVLNVAARESAKRLPVADVDLADLELDPPNYEVVFNDTVVGIGGVEPLKFRRYVRIGDTVHLISDPPDAALDADPADLMTKKVLREGGTVTRIEVPQLTVTRADPGWTVDGAEMVSADQPQAFVDAWGNAKAMWNQRYTPDEESADGGAALRVTYADGAVDTFTVVAREPQFIIRRDGTAVQHHLSKALADLLTVLPEPEPEPAGTAAGESPAGAEPPPTD